MDQTHGFLPGTELLQRAALDVALVAEAVAVFIIAAAILLAVGICFRGVLQHAAGRESSHAARSHPDNHARVGLARSLALALEFLLAADVVRTAVAPTWEEIGKLAAIALIRSGLNYFLHLELRELRQSPGQSGGATGAERPAESPGTPRRAA